MTKSMFKLMVIFSFTTEKAEVYTAFKEICSVFSVHCSDNSVVIKIFHNHYFTINSNRFLVYFPVGGLIYNINFFNAICLQNLNAYF